MPARRRLHPQEQGARGPLGPAPARRQRQALGTGCAARRRSSWPSRSQAAARAGTTTPRPGRRRRRRRHGSRRRARRTRSPRRRDSCSGTFPVGQLKAGSHPDFTSFLQAAATGDTTTVSVLAMHAGEQVPGEAADLGPRVWRELARTRRPSQPVTPLALGRRTGSRWSPTRDDRGDRPDGLPRAAIGQWVVVVICTAVGPRAADAIAATCDASRAPSGWRTPRRRRPPTRPRRRGRRLRTRSTVPAGFAAADPP